MAYKRIAAPEGCLFHYTKKEHLEAILQDDCIRRFGDRECWFCTSLEDTMRLMEMTVMKEGHPYVNKQGFLRRYPAFIPEEYIILKLKQRHQNGDSVQWNQEMPHGCPPDILAEAEEFSGLKVGFRGDLKFYQNPEMIDVASILMEQDSDMGMTFKQ